MQLVRNLPASDAASDLARPSVDLAVGRWFDPAVVDEVRTLAGELVSETASRTSGHTIELAVSTDARSVHLEVRWAGDPPERVGVHRTARVVDTRSTGILATIHGLADRWGLTHRDGRHCLWVEKQIAAGRPGSARPPRAYTNRMSGSA
jgi:hypothetical protein